MAGNSFGHIFRVTTAGESHGEGYLAIIDGCPPGLQLSEDDLLSVINAMQKVFSHLPALARQPSDN